MRRAIPVAAGLVTLATAVFLGVMLDRGTVAGEGDSTATATATATAIIDSTGSMTLTPLPTSGSYLYLQGDPGDYILGGRQLLVTADDFWIVEGNASRFRAMTYSAGWQVELAAPSGEPLQPGTYEGAMRFPFQAPDKPGLDVTGDGRGCNQSSGSFVINEAVFGPNDSVISFDATFEQHCEIAAPALRGRIHVESTPQPMRTPNPRPTSGSFLYLHSDPHDYIGRGHQVLFTSDTAAFDARYDGSRFTAYVNWPSDEWWHIDLQAPSGQPLTVGTYNAAFEYPFQGSGEPALSVYGDGRDCDTLGKFIVQEAIWGPNNSVVKFDATFEQHCKGWVPALFGEVRIDNEPAPTATPTLTPTPTYTPVPPTPTSTRRPGVGGTVLLSPAAVQGADNESGTPYHVLLGIAVGGVAVVAGGWFVRRRRAR